MPVSQEQIPVVSSELETANDTETNLADNQKLPNPLAQQVIVKPQIGQWNSLNFTFGAGKSLPQDGMITADQKLKTDHGRQKILRWVAAALVASSPEIRPADQWAEEEDLVSLAYGESRWAKEFNDAYQGAMRQQGGRPDDDFKMHTVFTFAPFKNVVMGLGETERATPPKAKATQVHEDQTFPVARTLASSFNRLLNVRVNLVAYQPENGTLRFLAALPPAAVHYGALQVQFSLGLDPAAMQAVMQNRELLGLQLNDFELTEKLSYKQWKKMQQKNKALVVISTPEGTWPYYVWPHQTLGEVLKIYDPQIEQSREQVLKFGGHLVTATNTTPEGLQDAWALPSGEADLVFFSSHALKTKLKAQTTYYVALASAAEISMAHYAWSPWQEREVRFALGDRQTSAREALRFARPLEKGDRLEIELLRESEFIDEAHRAKYFQHRYTSGANSTSNYINVLEALDAMNLSWEIGDRHFALPDCHVPGSKVYYYDFWQSLPGVQGDEIGKLHHAQAFVDWPIKQSFNLPIFLFWHHSSLNEQYLGQWIKAVKIKVRGRVWQRRL